MSKIHTEEKSPLLYAEETHADGTKPRKKVYFEKHHRLKDISSGATAVFTHFPDYIGTCWITTALCGLIFFMIMLLLLSTINSNTLRVPRCVAGDELNNKTVHLVHTYGHDVWKPKEIEIIDKIMKTYQDYKIHLILIREEFPKTASSLPAIVSHLETEESDSETTTTAKAVKPKNFLKRRNRRNINYRTNFNVEAKRLLDMLLHGKFMDKNYTEKVYVSEKLSTTQKTAPTTTEKTITTVDDILKSYPNIIVENTTFNQVFFNSPLYGYWLEMKEELRIFAVRVLQLWQYGGISFDLQPSPESIERVSIKNHSNITQNIDTIYDTKILKFVITGKDKYEALPDSVVAADDEGLHMESKVPCHAFFGQILMNLRRARQDTSVQDVLQTSVAVFCKHYAAEKKYCDKLLEKKI